MHDEVMCITNKVIHKTSNLDFALPFFFFFNSICEKRRHYMSKTIVALDCMGGDNAPFEIVKGAVEATNENKDILVKLVGVEEQIKEELSKYKYNSDQLEIVNATEIIETGEPPVAAIREKTDSSLVKCLYMVKKGEADGMVSAGSTGANLVGGHVIIGRLKGVQRPPLAPLIPTKNGAALLIDCGANVDCGSCTVCKD